MKSLSVLALASVLIVSFVTSVSNTPPREPVRRSHYTLYFDNERYIAEADTALGRARTQLVALLNASLDYRPDIHLTGDHDHFLKLLGGTFPDWGAAAAVPSMHLIAVKSPDRFNLSRPLSELLAHEYSHLVLAKRTGFYSAPRWFDEGLAMTVSMEWSWSDNLAMSKAAVFNQLIPLSEIERVNRFDEGKAHVAYAESYLAVSYLFKAYGVDGVNRFLDRISAGASLDSALETATGATATEFEKDFRDTLVSRFNVTSLFMDTIYFWTFLALLVVLGGYLKYRHRRSYYKKWKEEEKFQSTDFDYGDSENPESTEDDEPWRQ